VVFESPDVLFVETITEFFAPIKNMMIWACQGIAEISS
jgi:hypothetical protein